MKFSTFLGNEKVKSELSILMESNRFPHAIILEGDTGIGKRTLAKEIAANLFCRVSKNDACFKCPQCHKVMNGLHPDVYEYTASGAVNSFHVEKVREVKENVYMQPNEANYKVYILGNCQCMSLSSQNALLKVLEEPPQYAVFILTTTSKLKLLETVLSRCTTFSLHGVDIEQGAEYICKCNEKVSYNDAKNALITCGGNIGKALLTINDGKLSKISKICNDICEALLEDNEYSLLVSLSVFDKNKGILVEATNLLKTIFRDAMLNSVDTQCLSGQTQIAKKLSTNLTKHKLIKMINVCDDIVDLANRNANNTVLITKFCYELRRAQNR